MHLCSPTAERAEERGATGWWCLHLTTARPASEMRRVAFIAAGQAGGQQGVGGRAGAGASRLKKKQASWQAGRQVGGRAGGQAGQRTGERAGRPTRLAPLPNMPALHPTTATPVPNNPNTQPLCQSIRALKVDDCHPSTESISHLHVYPTTEQLKCLTSWLLHHTTSHLSNHAWTWLHVLYVSWLPTRYLSLPTGEQRRAHQDWTAILGIRCVYVRVHVHAIVWGSGQEQTRARLRRCHTR